MTNKEDEDKFWLDELANRAAIIKQMDDNQKLQQLRSMVKEFDRTLFSNRGRKLRLD